MIKDILESFFLLKYYAKLKKSKIPINALKLMKFAHIFERNFYCCCIKK